METKIINLTIKADDDPQEVKENLKKILAGVDSDLDPEDIDEIVAGVTEKINARRSLMEKAHEAWKEHKDAIRHALKSAKAPKEMAAELVYVAAYTDGYLDALDEDEDE